MAKRVCMCDSKVFHLFLSNFFFRIRFAAHADTLTHSHKKQTHNRFFVRRMDRIVYLRGVGSDTLRFGIHFYDP